MVAGPMTAAMCRRSALGRHSKTSKDESSVRSCANAHSSSVLLSSISLISSSLSSPEVAEATWSKCHAASARRSGATAVAVSRPRQQSSSSAQARCAASSAKEASWARSNGDGRMLRLLLLLLPPLEVSQGSQRSSGASAACSAPQRERFYSPTCIRAALLRVTSSPSLAPEGGSPPPSVSRALTRSLHR